MTSASPAQNASDTAAKVGAIRVCDAREYGRDAGFVIEQFGYGQSDEPSWAIPAWDELGLGSLAEVFPTFHAARRALLAANV